MGRYDYREAIINDLKDWIINETDLLENINNIDDDDFIEWIEDEAFSQDSITGNGSEYYDTEEKCSEYLSGNYDLLYEAAYEFCMDDDINGLIKHYENKSLARYFDCTIRCYLLRECIEEVIKTIKKKYKIKYKLTYEWEEDEASILDYKENNECTFEEAIEKLKEWNREQIADRIDTRAANIMSNYTSTFNCEVVQE